MTKQFLVITSNRSTTTTWADRESALQEFMRQLEVRVPNVQILYTTYDDITCTVIDGTVMMRDMRHDIDLAEVAMVHFKNWLFDSEQASMIACYLEHHDITYFNSEVNAGLAWGKISQMVRLAYGSVRVPNTYFAKNRRMRDAFSTNQLPAGFSFPLILKADDGAKGNDNHLIKTPEQATSILDTSTEKHYVVQNFLPNEGDYRFLFFGTYDAPIIFHRKATDGGHLNNTSQGGSGSAVDPQSLPPDYIPLARQAAIILKREISGVDILVDTTDGTAYVLEVNATPAIVTGYDVEHKNKLFAAFLEKQLGLGAAQHD